VVIVSHDRYFIEGLATRIVEVGGGTARVHEMGYADWLREHGAGQDAEAALRGRGSLVRKPDPAQMKSKRPVVADNSAAKATLAALSGIAPRDGARKKENPDHRRQKAEARNRLSARIKEVEKGISKLEQRIAEIHAILSDPDAYTNGKATPEIGKESRELEQKLASMLKEWEGLSSEYEAVR
jgi:ATP-binding cassette subfamily F protein 3